MPTQKWCNVSGCKNFIFATLDDFAEYRYGEDDGTDEIKLRKYLIDRGELKSKLFKKGLKE